MPISVDKLESRNYLQFKLERSPDCTGEAGVNFIGLRISWLRSD